jgi:hypothetical protein
MCLSPRVYPHTSASPISRPLLALPSRALVPPSLCSPPRFSLAFALGPTLPPRSIVICSASYSPTPAPSHAAATSHTLTCASTATARRTRRSKTQVPGCQAGAPSPVIVPAQSLKRTPVKTEAVACPLSTGQNPATSARTYHR